MNDICAEITTFSRVSERLLSKERKLTDDERSLLEYYVSELSREFFSDKQNILELRSCDDKSSFV